MTDKKKIIIHAGFHRCASTAIQDLLRHRRPAIEAGGTRLLLREDLKGRLSGRQLRLLYRFDRAGLLSRLRLMLAARLLRSAPEEHILVSEENLPGMMPGVQGVGFYPHFAAFLMALKALSDEFDIALRLVVRRQDHYLESAYAFRVARGYKKPFPDFLESVGGDSVSWLAIAEAVNAAGLASNCAIVPLEAWPRENPGGAALRFLGFDAQAADRVKLSGNPRRSETELQAYIGAPVQVGFTSKERQAFLAQHATANAQFLSHPLVDAPEGVWDY